jgi:hypothetical protein
VNPHYIHGSLKSPLGPASGESTQPSSSSSPRTCRKSSRRRAPLPPRRRAPLLLHPSRPPIASRASAPQSPAMALLFQSLSLHSTSRSSCRHRHSPYSQRRTGAWEPLQISGAPDPESYPRWSSSGGITIVPDKKLACAAVSLLVAPSLVTPTNQVQYGPLEDVLPGRRRPDAGHAQAPARPSAVPVLVRARRHLQAPPHSHSRRQV